MEESYLMLANTRKMRSKLDKSDGVSPVAQLLSNCKSSLDRIAKLGINLGDPTFVELFNNNLAQLEENSKKECIL